MVDARRHNALYEDRNQLSKCCPILYGQCVGVASIVIAAIAAVAAMVVIAAIGGGGGGGGGGALVNTLTVPFHALQLTKILQQRF